jgi:hypothetical protein
MRGYVMSSQKLFAFVPMACLLAAGLVIAPAVDGAAAGRSLGKHRESGRTYQLESRQRARGPRIHLPVGPSYIYYDYPYYYSRGYYPTHIGGYIYDYPFDIRRGGRCSDWRRGCEAIARRQRGACRCP